MFIGEMMVGSGRRYAGGTRGAAERQSRKTLLFEDRPCCPNQGLAEVAVVIARAAFASPFLWHINRIFEIAAPSSKILTSFRFTPMI
jgi:hypothetical protein